MPIFRVEKTNDYTIMCNFHFKEKEMSLKAKGLLSLMLSLPDCWDYSIAGLVAICKENENAINSALKELEIFGYLKRNKIFPNKNNNGRIEYEYIIYEKSINYQKIQGGGFQGVEIQGVEFQGVEIQGVENQVQLNTNNQILNSNENTISNDIVYPNLNSSLKQDSLLDFKDNKKNKKVKDIMKMKDMILAYTNNEDIRKKLTEYFNIRVKKNLQPNQWKIILEDLRKYAVDDADIAIDKINNAIAAGYMQIIASWEKNAKNKKYKPNNSFDNIADKNIISVVNMTAEEKDIFDQDLARDENGNLLVF